MDKCILHYFWKSLVSVADALLDKNVSHCISLDGSWFQIQIEAILKILNMCGLDQYQKRQQYNSIYHKHINNITNIEN